MSVVFLANILRAGLRKLTMFRPYVFIGFAGNRNLANSTHIAVRIREALDRIEDYTSGPLAAISSAAKGADTLFIESIFSRTPPVPWILLLPLPASDFFNTRDFSQDELDRLRPFLNRATRVHVEPASDPSLPEAVRRGNLFADCSARTVDECDYLIAVWDGLGGRPGGTGGTVAYAREQKKPLVWIHADTGEITTENFPTNVAPKHAPAPPEIDPVTGGLPALQATLDHYDREAILHAPKARNLIAWVVWLHLGATVLALLGPIALSKPYHWMAVAGIGLIVLKIAVLLFADRLAHHQHHAKHDWLRSRIIAELCRSAIATWPLPYARKTHEPFNIPYFRAWQRSLGLWRTIAPPVQPQKPGDAARTSFESMRDAYLETRFDAPSSGQIPYFEKQLRRAETKHNAARYWARAFTWLAIAGALTVAIVTLPDVISGQGHESSYAEKIVKWLSLALPLASSAVFTHLLASDYHRRTERNREILAHLRVARERIKRATTHSGLERRVAETETLLLLEVLEWHSITHFTSNAH